MGDSLLIENIEEKLPLPSLDMDSFINMLWDQDMDMGVDRQFYDPVYREQEQKKREAEQNKLLELKKRQAKQAMLNFIIDEETGERIPKPSAGPYQSPAEFTDDTDLSKELAELGDIADLSYFLGEEPKNQSEPEQLFSNDYTTEQSAQRASNNYNMIIQTAGQPSPVSDVDLWPTEITMLPGPSADNSSMDMAMTSEQEMFMSQVWGLNRPQSSSGIYTSYTDGVEAPPPYQRYHDEIEMGTNGDNGYQNSAPAHNPYINMSSSDSAFSSEDACMDGFGNDSSNCSYSSQAFSEDVKPSFMYSQNQNGSLQHNSTGSTGSTLSSGSLSLASSENEDNISVNNQERERRSACRDELRCKELGIPFSVELITNCPVEEFNSLLRQHMLSEEQLTLVKDIRRRGKNKVAAQNCRKKKMNELTGLEVEINDLKRKRSELMRDKDDLKRSKLHLRKQLDQTYAEVFNSIRDHLGRPYDPRFYTLHISDDGDARVIPNKVSTYALLNYHQTA